MENIIRGTHEVVEASSSAASARKRASPIIQQLSV